MEPLENSNFFLSLYFFYHSSLITVKSPPQGQGRFIKIADPSVCPTKGDFFFEGHLVIRTRPSGDSPDPSVCPTGGDSTSVLGGGGLYCSQKVKIYLVSRNLYNGAVLCFLFLYLFFFR